MNKTVILLIQLQNLVLGLDASLNGRINCLRSYIPREHLDRFDALLHKGRPPVAALTAAGRCSGCRLPVPPRLWWMIRRSRNQIHVCRYCGCFIYLNDPSPKV